MLCRALLALCAMLSACERSKAKAEPPSETKVAKTPHDRSKAFHELDEPSKGDRMVEVVLPEMAAVFRAFDGRKFAGFDCDTCHVDGAHHPKDGLPKLVLSNGGFEKLAAEEPEMMKFMGEQVLPAMAKAMAEPVIDPATGKGFGCNGCHTVE